MNDGCTISLHVWCGLHTWLVEVCGHIGESDPYNGKTNVKTSFSMSVKAYQALTA